MVTNCGGRRIKLVSNLMNLKAGPYLAVVAAELADDTASGDVPVKDLPVRATRNQLRIIPAHRNKHESNSLQVRRREDGRWARVRAYDEEWTSRTSRACDL